MKKAHGRTEGSKGRLRIPGAARGVFGALLLLCLCGPVLARSDVRPAAPSSIKEAKPQGGGGSAFEENDADADSDSDERYGARETGRAPAFDVAGALNARRRGLEAKRRAGAYLRPVPGIWNGDPDEAAVDGDAWNSGRWGRDEAETEIAKTLFKRARSEYPEGFGDGGWHLQRSLVADLDRDGELDAVFLLKQVDPARVFLQGEDLLDFNDHMIAAFLSREGEVLNAGWMKLKTSRQSLINALSASGESTDYLPPRMRWGNGELVVERAWEVSDGFIYTFRRRWILENDVFRLARDEQEMFRDGRFKGYQRDFIKGEASSYGREAGADAYKAGDVNTDRIERENTRLMAGLKVIRMSVFEHPEE